VPGSKVSFIFEADNKSGKAKDVQIEEAAVAPDEGPREFGTIKVLYLSLWGLAPRAHIAGHSVLTALSLQNWNAEKGFGFIGRTSGEPE